MKADPSQYDEVAPASARGTINPSQYGDKVAPASARGAICVALDLEDEAKIRSLAETLGPRVGALKIGLRAFSACGPAVVRDLAADGDVFVDLKLHDIPAQVEGAVGVIGGLGARYTTVHAAGGPDMIDVAVKAAPDSLTVVAVTLLTSLDGRALERIGLHGTPSDVVTRLAALALDAGAGGLVCSPLEVATLRTRFGPRSENGPILIVPGIRPAGSEVADQKRVATPKAAFDAGADLLVVGRPITGADDPVAATESVLAELT